jgi:hypothetical protein
MAERHPNGRYRREGYGQTRSTDGTYHADERDLSLLFSPVSREAPKPKDYGRAVRRLILPGGGVVYIYPEAAVLPGGRLLYDTR